MATYVEILKNEFPEIDSEVFDYITGESPRPELDPEHNSAAVRWRDTPGSDQRVSPGVRPSFGANGLILRLRVDQRGFGRGGSPSPVWPKAPVHLPSRVRGAKPRAKVEQSRQASRGAFYRKATGSWGGGGPESVIDAKLI